MNDFIVEENRIYLEKEGKLLAEITYNKEDENTYVIDHTFVDELLRGQGIASKLVEKAVEEIKKKNGIVKATCSYAKSWLEKHEI
ncbi:MAG: N-acetyltransferase [Clostridia bacterium]|nr:N-acetyltransferase [Clostridia bacterium]